MRWVKCCERGEDARRSFVGILGVEGLLEECCAGEEAGRATTGGALSAWPLSVAQFRKGWNSWEALVMARQRRLRAMAKAGGAFRSGASAKAVRKWLDFSAEQKVVAASARSPHPVR